MAVSSCRLCVSDIVVCTSISQQPVEFGVNDRDGNGTLQYTITISIVHSKLDHCNSL